LRFPEHSERHSGSLIFLYNSLGPLF
jgi:hypothetical protein